MIKDYSTKPFTFKKKPVAIEAIKWTGTNFDTIKMFDPDVMLSGEGELIIPTLEDGKFVTAKHVATVGDFVIRDVHGEFYFCKPDIFMETYEEVTG